MLIVATLLTPYQWRYTLLALQFLNGLLRRDVVPPPDVARLFINHTLSPHLPLRTIAQKSVFFSRIKSRLSNPCRGIIKLLIMVKIRTYSRTSTDLWLEEWESPIAKYVPIKSDHDFHTYVNKVPSIKDE